MLKYKEIHDFVVPENTDIFSWAFNIIKDKFENIVTNRDWWKYEIIENWNWYKLKILLINPWKSISLQKHSKREEHWKILEWKWEVQLWNDKNYLQEVTLIKWKFLFIPKWNIHKIKNIWKDVLKILELQVWEELDEEDIERLS